MNDWVYMRALAHRGRLFRRQTCFRRGTVCLAVIVLLVIAPAITLAQPLNQNCIVSVLNRTAQVQANGVWVLPNVPANISRVRVRATCVENGITRSGQSDYITVPVNGVLKVGEINLDAPVPIPANLSLTAPQTTLTSIGATVQLTATVSFSDGRTADVSLGEQGTNYSTSNANIVSVSENGFVTARASGAALTTALNEGAIGMAS